jgi:endogenous inhibitor of DNA gyrase (YacG/DUF329 family)
MSLKDLLPEGTYEEILQETNGTNNVIAVKDSEVTKVLCPTCHKEVNYDKSNPFRPFCSEKCRTIELAAWAQNKRFIKGVKLEDDEDAGELHNQEFMSSNHTQQ